MSERPTDDASSNLIESVDRATEAVAALLPFPATLEADLGGTFALHIDLGVDGDQDDPHDRAMLDPEESPVPMWYFDYGDRNTAVSPYTLDSDPALVAEWITMHARLADSPAARTHARAAADQPSLAGPFTGAVAPRPQLPKL